MQIRFENPHSMQEQLLWIDDAVGDVNKANNSNSILSITHFEGTKKEKAVNSVLKSLEKKPYCALSKTAGSLL
jgi:hypothetical protein